MQKLLGSQRMLPSRFLQIVRYFRANAETYYDILQVPSNCTTKDIRNAFVRLSKEYHPDAAKGKRSNRKTTDRFVKISEAYQTLYKPRLRNVYDENLWHAKRTAAQRNWQAGDAARKTVVTNAHRPWEMKSFYNFNARAYNAARGMKGTSNFKVPNVKSAIYAFGALLGFTSVKQSFTSKRLMLEEGAPTNKLHQPLMNPLLLQSMTVRNNYIEWPVK